MKIKLKHKILQKFIVNLLVFCMIFETAPMHVSASEYIYSPDYSSASEPDSVYSDDSGSNVSEPDGNTVVNPDSSDDSFDNTDRSNDSSGNADSSSDSSVNPDNSNDSSNNPDNSNDSSNNPDNSNDGSNNPDSSDDGSDNPDSSDDGSDNPDNSYDSSDNPDNNDGTSGNTDSDSDSENITDSELTPDSSLETIPDTGVSSASDLEYMDYIQEAEKAFEAIVSNKDVMALIYMTDVYHIRSLAERKSGIAAELESGHTVYLRGVTITPNAIWYKVNFWINGVQKEGYAEHEYLAFSDEDWIKWCEEYLYKYDGNDRITFASEGSAGSYAASYADVEQFPAGYQNALNQLKASHPNWTFVPMNTKLDFNAAVSAEMGVKSLIQNTGSNASNGWVGSSCPTTSGWYYATQDAVAYYMDPRNFLTETYIFQFEQLTFNSSYHTVDAIQTFLASTFMNGTLPDDSQKRTYAQAFYEIGSGRKLSPIHLASRVYQEQGKGTSGLISGKYPGYEGYYNFFNVQANGKTDDEVIKNGLAYAKSMNWNTRYKSLEGGAATIGNNYILKGQDTLYLEKFNVNSNSPYGLYEHQYMQNIQAPASESASTKKMYSGAGSLNSAFVFKIPVYSNMPGLKLSLTKASINKGESLTLTASVNGAALNSSDVAWKSSDTSIVSVSSGIVTAIDAGTATVTASYDGSDASCVITVVNPLQQISLDKETITLRRPDTVVEDTSHLSAEEIAANTATASLKVSFEPEDTTDDKTIVWSSSNKKAATVDNGVITAVGAGETIITAKASKAGNKTAECKVTVIAPVYKIEFSAENNTNSILAGQSVNLLAEYFPKDTTSDTTVLWKSSDTSVATVERTKGTVCGISAGTADITATIGGYSASCRITVKDCTVTFMDTDNKPFKTFSSTYGKEVVKEDFPNDKDIESLKDSEDSVFIGWYTGPDGTGSRFDYGAKIHQENTVLYPYFKKQEGGLYVIPVGDQTYTGSAIKPKVLVYDSAAYENSIKQKNAQSDGDDHRQPLPLVENRDYTLSYKNNKKTASADSIKPPTIMVKGKGNYTGTETITFNIVPKSVQDTDITFENITAAYTGKTIKGAPTLYHNGKKLIKNTDYKLTYPLNDAGAYMAAGTYPIIVTGNGGYCGTLTIYETITPKILLSKAKIAKIPDQPYEPSKIDKENGIGIEPELFVTYKNNPLVKSEDGGKSGDYTVTYKNNFTAGTATATITAVDSDDNVYIGSKSITFKITAVSIKKAVVNGVADKTYTGLGDDVMQDNLSVSLSGETLTQSPDGGITGDYILEYKNTGKAGTAAVIVKGINKYTGSVKKTYKINACDLSQIDKAQLNIRCHAEYDAENIVDAGSLDNISTPYVKGATKPVLLLSYKGCELTPGKDYTLKYKNNNAVTTKDTAENKLPMVTITGKGLFKGQISGNFKITDGAMSDADNKITMTAKDVVYKPQAGAYKTAITLTDANGKKLQAGKDYKKALHYTYVNETAVTDTQGSSITRNAGDEVNDNDIPAAGTSIRVTVSGIGAYSGTETASADTAAASKSAIYRIVAADISKAKVSVAAKTYDNGRPIELTEDDITVTLNGKNLTLGENYRIDSDTYVNNSGKGKASVIIYGIGAEYGGSKKISFTIKGKLLSWMK